MPMKLGDPMPPFDAATAWFNGSQAEVEQQIKGKPALIHFWSVSCSVCKDKMPDLHALTAKYAPLGLQVVSVHMPRYEQDTDLDEVRRAIEANHVTEPTAVDNLHKLSDAFQNDQGWVPVYYLFDAEGKLKMRAAGEYGVTLLTTALDKMFPAPSVAG